MQRIKEPISSIGSQKDPREQLRVHQHPLVRGVFGAHHSYGGKPGLPGLPGINKYQISIVSVYPIV